MASPTRGAQTSETQIEVLWSALSGDATGDSAITSYNLQWDAGTNGAQWFDILGEEGFPSLGLTYIQVSVTAGTQYQFKVRAANALGWGQYSLPATISAAAQPDSPDAPTVTLVNVLVQIAWNAPYDNSAQVNGYKVYVEDSVGTFRLETTYCNGLIEPVKT